MDIGVFKQKELRRTIKAKAGNKNISIQIINYDNALYDKWKILIEDAYKSGNEQLELKDVEINELFKDFTNIEMSINELNDILENPNHTFSTIFKEIQLIVNEMIVKFLQDKQLEMGSIKRQIEETKVLLIGEDLANTFNRLAEIKKSHGEIK